MALGDIGLFDGTILTQHASEHGPAWAEDLFLSLAGAQPPPVLLQDAVVAVILTSTVDLPIPGSHNARFLMVNVTANTTTYVKPGVKEVVDGLRRRNVDVTSACV